MSPSLAGTAAIQSPAHAFVDAFACRVETGLYRGAPPARCRYEVTETAPDKLRFRAMNFLTAISIGLNEVELAASPSGVVRYQVQYKHKRSLKREMEQLIADVDATATPR